MTSWKKYLCCVVLSGVLTGCIPAQGQMRMDQDMEEMKRRLAFVERQLTSLGLDLKDETGRGLTSMTKRQADLEADLDNLRIEVQTLKGRLEEVTRENRQLRDEMNLLRDDFSLKVSDLEERLSAKSSPPAAAAPEAVPQPPTTAKKPEDIYKEGLVLVRDEQRYNEAIEVFRAFLQESPDHYLAVNATYWIGEAYYGEKQYENAILQFQDVIQKFPSHSKAASAMYKQAFAFNAMGDNKNALVLLEKLNQTYPGSPEAGQAKTKMAEWK